MPRNNNMFTENMQIKELPNFEKLGKKTSASIPVETGSAEKTRAASTATAKSEEMSDIKSTQSKPSVPINQETKQRKENKENESLYDSVGSSMDYLNMKDLPDFAPPAETLNDKTQPVGVDGAERLENKNPQEGVEKATDEPNAAEKSQVAPQYSIENNAPGTIPAAPADTSPSPASSITPEAILEWLSKQNNDHAEIKFIYEKLASKLGLPTTQEANQSTQAKNNEQEKIKILNQLIEKNKNDNPEPRAPQQKNTFQDGQAHRKEVAVANSMVSSSIASLLNGTAKIVGTIGTELTNIAGFGGHTSALRPMTSLNEYRLKQFEKTSQDYALALTNFWAQKPMMAMRKEIEERARKSGISLQDAMAKMKPGGQWAKLHDRFIDEVANSKPSLQAKVALDSALNRYITQLNRSSDELNRVSAHDPEQRRAAFERIENIKKQMFNLTKELPVFKDDGQSHAERLAQAVHDITERLHRFLQAIGGKTPSSGPAP